MYILRAALQTGAPRPLQDYNNTQANIRTEGSDWPAHLSASLAVQPGCALTADSTFFWQGEEADTAKATCKNDGNGSASISSPDA